MTWAWGVAAAVALLWPAHAVGPLDGAPLDDLAKAILIGAVFPTLLWVHPAFLRSRLTHAIVIALLGWKGVTAIATVQNGWCVRFEPERPLVADATSPVPHSWDVRADWRSPRPVCSAVMRRDYTGIGEFPAWFFNLPPVGGAIPAESDRPPGARTLMVVTGFLETLVPGELRVGVGEDMLDRTTLYVDGLAYRDAARLEAGLHRVRLESMLVGSSWRLIPTWNGVSVWSSDALATVARPSAVNRPLHRAGRRLVALLVSIWIVTWTVSFLSRIGSPHVVAWLFVTSSWAIFCTVRDYKTVALWSIPALAAAASLPIPTRLRNLTGAVVLVGIPWLALIVAWGAGDVGRFWFYGVGHDYWTFQRAAYRIVMQGYWLEGGARTFYFQPLYRWIAGLLHLVFGDSSVGERYWDGGCVLAMALLAWRITDAYAGFRAGLIAMVLTFSVMALGAPWLYVGIGLSEISSAGFLYLAAHVALRSRRGPWAIALMAGVLATLGFYTRLNSLPMAAAAAAFAVPIRTTLRDVASKNPSTLAIAWRTVWSMSAVLALGVTLFAWRTWHYTGVFSVLYGTSHTVVAIWQPGASLLTNVGRSLGSVIMVLAVRDPAEFDWRALPVLVGSAAAGLALLGVPRFRDLPAAPIVFLLAGVAPALVVRGFGYAGRFSIPVIGVTCALAVCAVSSVLGIARTRVLPDDRVGLRDGQREATAR